MIMSFITECLLILLMMIYVVYLEVSPPSLDIRIGKLDI